jgi:hypothetical protein
MTMKTLKEKTAEIRSALKAAGINSKMVSVTGSYPGYDSKISVTIKDLTVSKATVEAAAKVYESYSRDVDGEILLGGNTYVRVDYDWKAISAAAALKTEEAAAILAAATEHFAADPDSEAYTIADYGKTKVVYYKFGACGSYPFPTIKVLEKPEGYEEMSCYCLDTLLNITAHNVPHIAQALVYIENKMY